jgi:hypothetical protein
MHLFYSLSASKESALSESDLGFMSEYIVWGAYQVVAVVIGYIGASHGYVCSKAINPPSPFIDAIQEKSKFYTELPVLEHTRTFKTILFHALIHKYYNFCSSVPSC